MTKRQSRTHKDDPMPAEIDFSTGARGKFHRTHVKLNLPVYLDQEVQVFLSALASKKGVEISQIANQLLKIDMAIADTLG